MPSSSYDAVIIGSGIAGALTAWQLASRGAKVLILEAGELPSDRRPLKAKYALSSSKSQSSPYIGLISPQPNYQDPPQPIAISQQFGRDYYVEDPSSPSSTLFTSYYANLAGGTTWHWQGLWLRMLPNDFVLQSQYGVGRDWPLSYDDLEPWYCLAEEECGVSGDSEALNGQHGAYRSRPFPMPPMAASYVDQRVAAALAGKSFGGVPLQLTHFAQAKNSIPYRGRAACDGRSSCIPLCPIDAKYEGRIHLQMALDSGATLRTASVVTKLEASGGRIQSVTVRGRDKVETKVAAGLVVLAANAIENPKLLLLSGLANGSDQVGRNLMDHPIKMSYALTKEPVFPYRGPPSTSSIEVLRDGPFRTHRAAFRTTIRNDGWQWPTGAPRGATLDPTRNRGTLLELAGNGGLFGAALRDELFRVASCQFSVNSATEMLPNPDNRVQLSWQRDQLDVPRPQIFYSVDDYARNAIRTAIGLHDQIFQAVGVTFSNLQPTIAQDAGSGHIMGTTIMGSDPATSVVDRDCRSHELPNLFILGSSVFPTASTANPTATIAALALRAAETIRRELGSA